MAIEEDNQYRRQIMIVSILNNAIQGKPRSNYFNSVK